MQVLNNSSQKSAFVAKATSKAYNLPTFRTSGSGQGK
jgi:hypothetical protein